MAKVARILAIFLGALFVAAGISKLVPADHRLLFEMAISAHRLVPIGMVPALGWAIPLGEILLGVLLIAGWKPPWTAGFAALLLFFFTGLMFSAYFRGIQSYCGCLGFGQAISPWTLARDTALFLLAAFIAVAAVLRRRRNLPMAA